MLGFPASGRKQNASQDSRGRGPAAALGALAGTPASAETKIGGDVRFYCGFAPGGTADLLVPHPGRRA